MKNWWYYYKWYVIVTIILLFVFTDIIGNYLGWFQDTPDIQIAYIGDNPLPEDMLSSLEDTFTSLAEDYNHDGKILIKVNQFVSGISMGDAQSLAYQQAAELALIGDIDHCTSYFFLMEHPEQIQREFQVLAMPDGNCPNEYDFSIDNKVIPWDCGLYLGRRCFYNKKQTPYAEECCQIWDKLNHSIPAVSM